MYHFRKRRYTSRALQNFVAQNISFDIEYLKQSFKSATFKNLEKLTQQSKAVSTKLLRVALKNRVSKKVKMASSQDLLNKRKESVVPLSKTDKKHLQQYENLGNQNFSRLLQTSTPLTGVAAQIDASLEKAILVNGEPCPPILYRAIKGLRASQLGLRVGMQYKIESWQSATRSIQQALSMSKFGTMFTLLIAPEFRADVLDMTPYSSDKSKMEVVLPKNAVLQVNRIDEGQGKTPDRVTMLLSFPNSALEKDFVNPKNAEGKHDKMGDKHPSTSKYMQSLIIPGTNANNGRFGADAILVFLDSKESHDITDVTGMSLSAHEAAQLYNDYMRASKLQHKTLDQGNIPVRNEKELAKWKQELDKAYDTYGSDVNSLSAVGSQKEFSKTTLKNYRGRMDERMHTTFLNLANPSQGRSSEAEIKNPAEPLPRTISQADINTSNLSGEQIIALNGNIFGRIVAKYGRENNDDAMRFLQTAQKTMPRATQLGTDTFVTEVSKLAMAENAISRLFASKPNDAFIENIVRGYSGTSAMRPETAAIRERIKNLLGAIESRLLAEISLWKDNPAKPFVDGINSRTLAGGIAKRLVPYRETAAFENADSVHIMRNLAGELTGLMHVRKSSQQDGFDEVTLLGANPSSTNRSGEALLVNLARSCAARGVGIKLDALTTALPFYYKMGFKKPQPLPTNPMFPPLTSLETIDNNLVLSRADTAALAQRKIKELTRERIVVKQKITGSSALITGSETGTEIEVENKFFNTWNERN